MNREEFQGKKVLVYDWIVGCQVRDMVDCRPMVWSYCDNAIT
jgi:hypothetical protein